MMAPQRIFVFWRTLTGLADEAGGESAEEGEGGEGGKEEGGRWKVEGVVTALVPTCRCWSTSLSPSPLQSGSPLCVRE